MENPSAGMMPKLFPATTVRSATMNLLRKFGINTIFGNPGSTELPMFRDFPDDFRYIMALQESVVVAMADGYAQATRNAAFINLHSAAGVGHALGNIFTASKNQTPLIITAGQQARSMLPFEPFLFAPNAAEFPKPHVKWSCEPARAEDVPFAIARAYYVAMQPPRGPVFVSVPVDDWDRECEPVEPRIVSQSIRGDAALLHDAALALATAAQPVFIIGAQIALENAWDDVISLAERHRAKVWISPMSGRNAFPENHPQFAGFLPPSRAKIVQALEGHDLAIVLGAGAFTYHTEGTGPFVPVGTKLIQLVDDPAMAAWAPVGTAIVTSMKAGLADLLTGPAPAQRKMPTPRDVPPRLTGVPFDAAYLVQQIEELRPANSVIVEEAPTTHFAMHGHMPIVRRDGYYTGGSGGLGFGLPASVGVALGRPGEHVIAIMGDGSSMYSIQALWNAAQLGLPITFIIVNNGGYLALERFGRIFGLERTYGTRVGTIDFAALAQSLGCASVRVDSAQALDPALSAAFKMSSPMLIEVKVT